MYPPKFEYYRAASVQEAISLKQAHEGAKYLAGGHSLIPILNLRLDDPGTLIDIGRISELRTIFVDRGFGPVIGALSTHAEVAASSDVPRVLAEAASMIGDPQVRNRGTVGGNLAHADPASDLPTVFMALNASFEITGPEGHRSVLTNDFFIGLFETALNDGDILTQVRVRSFDTSEPFDHSAGSAYAKLSNPASRYAMVGAAAVIRLADGKISHASVAVGGLTPTPTRASSVEAALLGKAPDGDTIGAAADEVQNDIGDYILGDIHAGAEYRRAMAPVFVKRAVTSAAQRAGNPLA